VRRKEERKDKAERVKGHHNTNDHPKNAFLIPCYADVPSARRKGAVTHKR